MTSSSLGKAIILLTVLLICVFMLPLPGVKAGSGVKAAGEAVEEQSEFMHGNVHISEDALKRNPGLQKTLNTYLEQVPEQMIPDSLKEKSDDKTTGIIAGGGEAGAGTGGWTPLAGAYTPDADPATGYDFRIGNELNRVDSNGAMHSVITITTDVDIHQAPDPTALDTPLAKMYYVSNVHGNWSTPVCITPTAGLEDTYTALWDLDDNGYLHFVYAKWTWGRNAAAPVSDPPNPNDYIPVNENIFYRYMAPDGTWSTPLQITNFTGAWGFNGSNFELIGNRIYGSAIAEFNKQLSPAAYTTREIFIEGIFNEWQGPRTLREWDHGWADGDEIAFMPPAYGVSGINGEISLVFGTYINNSSPYLEKSFIYGAAKTRSGTWSSTETLLDSGLNEIWSVGFIIYDRNSVSSTTWVSQNCWGSDATHEPFGNVYFLDHETTGWKTLKNMTRVPSKELAGSASLMLDPFDNWHAFFSVIHQTWSGAAWVSNGGSLHYTYQAGGALTDIQQVYPYVSGRAAGNIDAELDRNGAVHAVFETIAGAPATHTVCYTDNTGGSWVTAENLSVDMKQTIGWLVLTVGPEGRSIVSWSEKKLSPASVPEIGRIYSMSYKDGTWSERKNISEVPGSSDIVHVEAASPEYLNIVDGNQGDQICFFETAKYDLGTTTYYDFKKYFNESMNGVWGTPELISTVGMSGEGEMVLDLNNIARIKWDFTDAATGKHVLYTTMQNQPTPPATTYYFAEGTTRDGFQEWLSLENTGGADANVEITYMLGTGENKEQAVVVPPHSRVTVDVNGFVGPGQDVSASVVADRPVVAERPMYFNYKGTEPGGDVAIGATDTSRVLYFAEGTTRAGFTEYLTLQNPSDTDTDVTITYMFGDGTTKQQEVKVNKKSRQTVDVNAFIGADKDVSVKIESPNVAIAAERPMYFNYHGLLHGGHEAVGTSVLDNRWYFAEGTTRAGFDTYLCLQNPGPVDATATVTYIMGDGTTRDAQVNLRATSRQTVNVRDIIGSEKDVSMVVSADTLILAERPMYFDYHGFAQGGHNVVGGRSPKNAWYLAEGTTRTGFDEWLCLENAGGENATAAISYMLGDGSVVNQNVAVPAHTRVTVDVRLAVGNDKDVSTYIWCDRGIIVERPMYFNNGDRRWNGGSCAMGL